MAEFPAMPLWTDAYLGDTNHLTTIEHGAFLLLLITAWRAKTHTLPDDDRMLARYARLTVRQWQRIRPIIEPFFLVENGQWSNGRLLDEVDAVRRQVQQRSNAGKSSALKRKNRGSTVVQRECNENPTPTPTPTPTPKREVSKGRARGTRLPDDWKPDEIDIAFCLAEGLTEDGAKNIGDRYRDYWIAQPGQKGVKRDWRATWRNWVRRDLDGSGGKQQSGERRENAGAVKTAARIIDRLERGGNLRG